MKTQAILQHRFKKGQSASRSAAHLARERLARLWTFALLRTRRSVAALEGVVRTQDVPAFVIAALPRTLADLRRAFHDDVKARIVAEVGKDLTKHPAADIEVHLFG